MSQPECPARNREGVRILNGVEWTQQELDELIICARNLGFRVFVRRGCLELRKRRTVHYRFVVAGLWLFIGLLTFGLTFL